MGEILIVCTAGNASDPVAHNHTDLPVDEGGLLVVRSDLVSPVPNAQHVVRQGRRPAKNLVADLRGRRCRAVRSRTAGAAAVMPTAVAVAFRAVAARAARVSHRRGRPRPAGRPGPRSC